MSAEPSDEDLAMVARITEAIPEPWSAIFVLARFEKDGGADLLTGGRRISRENSIKLLRQVLAQLESGQS